jgi:hypothetical protein
LDRFILAGNLKANSSSIHVASDGVGGRSVTDRKVHIVFRPINDYRAWGEDEDYLSLLLIDVIESQDYRLYFIGFPRFQLSRPGTSGIRPMANNLALPT